MSVKYYNPYTKNVEQEKVCGEFFLHFLYESFVGKIFLWVIVKRIFFSKIFGVWANLGISKLAVKKFIDENGISTLEMKNDYRKFRNFNEFFYRELKETSRPVDGGEGVVVFPADGRHLAKEDISKGDIFYVKGQKFDLRKFLGSEKLAERFDGGSILISRLCPLDYHRFHYCVSGHLCARKKLNGFLYSVSPIALRKNISYLWQNKRILNLIEMEDKSFVAMVEVGATNVGSIKNIDEVGDIVEKGRCKGYFEFGGSCIVTIFEKGKVKFDSEILEYSRDGLEYFSKVNSRCGNLCP